MRIGLPVGGCLEKEFPTHNIESGECLAWFTWPVFMLVMMSTTLYCLAHDLDKNLWIPALTVMNFIVIVILEAILPARPEMKWYKDLQSINDAFHGALAALIRPLGLSLGLLLLVMISTRKTLGITSILWPDTWPILLQLVLVYMIYSFIAYWWHRCLHSVDRLWWFHAIHHDTNQMHVLKSGRFHFGEEAMAAIILPLPLLLLGAPTELIILRSMWSVFDGSMHHANVAQRFPAWFHYFWETVQLHNLHHSQHRHLQDSNYSILPLWDILFGTYRHPGRNDVGIMGIRAHYIPANFFQQLYFPFQKQVEKSSPPRVNG